MAVLGVGVARFPERRDRRIALAELLADFAEREPGGGKAGRKFGRLQQQIGGGGKIALELQIAREIEPPVGNQIAGGQEQARGHLNEPVVIAVADPAIHRSKVPEMERGQARA